MGIQTRHNRRPARSAHRLGDVRVLENERPISDAVQIRRFDPIVAVASERILALLVGEDDENVWPIGGVGSSCHGALRVLRAVVVD